MKETEQRGQYSNYATGWTLLPHQAPRLGTSQAVFPYAPVCLCTVHMVNFTFMVLIFQCPTFTHAKAHEKTPPEFNVIYLGNKEM